MIQAHRTINIPYPYLLPHNMLTYIAFHSVHEYVQSSHKWIRESTVNECIVRQYHVNHLNICWDVARLVLEPISGTNLIDRHLREWKA